MKEKYSNIVDNINPYPKTRRKTTSKLTTATRSGTCYFCEKPVEIGSSFWWYPNSKRAFHTQCKGLSKNAQKGVTVTIMTPTELEAYRAKRG
jgi:hypothetical protein